MKKTKRGVLKGIGASVTGSLLTVRGVGANETAAKEAEVGNRRFSEIKLEWDIPERFTRLQVDEQINYSTHSDGLFLLNDRHFEAFKSGSTISTRGRRFSTSGDTLFGNEKISLVDSMDYRGGVTSCVDILGSVTQPELDVMYKGNSIVISKDDNRYVVDSGQERQIALEPISVKIRPPSEETIKKTNPADRGPAELQVPKKKEPVSVEITPEVAIHNHGNMRVYGKKDSVVVPANSNDPIVESIIARLPEKARAEANMDKNEIIIIEEDKQ